MKLLTKEAKCYFCKGLMPVGSRYGWQKKRGMAVSRKYGAVQKERFVIVHFSQSECEQFKCQEA